MRQIYLDFNATTPIDPRVAESMRAAMNDGYGNPSSPHWAGVPAQRMVEASRKRVASLLSCSLEEVVFTSGGSQANNFGLKGAFCRARRVTFVGSRMPISIISPYSFVAAL